MMVNKEGAPASGGGGRGEAEALHLLHNFMREHCSFPALCLKSPDLSPNADEEAMPSSPSPTVGLFREVFQPGLLGTP